MIDLARVVYVIARNDDRNAGLDWPRRAGPIRVQIAPELAASIRNEPSDEPNGAPSP